MAIELRKPSAGISQTPASLKMGQEAHIWKIDEGMRLKEEPHLIPAGAARLARDVDVRTGALVPRKKLGTAQSLPTAGTGPARSFALMRIGADGTTSWHSATLSVSYVHWNNNLVFSRDGSATATRPGIIYAEAGTPEYYLGITPPATLSENATARVHLAATWEHHLVHHEGEPIDYTDTSYPLLVTQDLHGQDPEEGDWFSWAVDDRNTKLIFDVRTALAGVATVSWYWYGGVGGVTGWQQMTASSSPVALRQKTDFATVTETDPGESPVVLRWQTLSAPQGQKLYIRTEFEGLSPTLSDVVAPFIARSWQADGHFTSDPTTVDKITGDIRIKMTHVHQDSTVGKEKFVESAAGPPGTDDFLLLEGLESVHGIRLNDLPVPATISGELPVSHKKLYRTLANEPTNYIFLETLSNDATTTTLWQSDAEVALNPPMLSDKNYLPGYYDKDGDGVYTFDLDQKIVGLVYHDGHFYSVANSDLTRLVRSQPDNPHGWDPDDDLFFPNEIQGFHSTDVGLLVVTESGPWIVPTGQYFTKHKLNGNWNCQAIGSMVDTPYGVMWASRNAVVLFDGISVKEISRIKVNDIPIDSSVTALTAQWFQDQYILMSDVGTLIADFREGLDPKWTLWGWDGADTFTPATYGIYGSYYDPVEDKLWVGKQSGYRHEMFGADLTTTRAEYMSMNWHSAEFCGTDLEMDKVFDRVNVSYLGELFPSLIVDNTSLGTGHLSTLPDYDRDRGVIYYPEDLTSSVGQGTQVQIVGRGVVYSMKVHFDYKSRFNKKMLFLYMLVKTEGPCDLIGFVDGNAMDYYTGVLDGWTIESSGQAEYKIPFDPNTVGFIPQCRTYDTSGSSLAIPALRSVEYIAVPIEEMSEEFWVNGVRVGHAGAIQAAIYGDGTTITYGGGTVSLAGDGDDIVFAAPGTRARRMQVHCFEHISGTPTLSPTGDFQKAEWLVEPIEKWDQRIIMHAARAMVVESPATVWLFADGVTSSTTTVSETGEHHFFFAANEKGKYPQIICQPATAVDYQTLQWMIEPDEAHSEPSYFSHVRFICDDGTTGSVHLDGAQHGSDTTLSAGRNDVFFSLGAEGYLGQAQWNPGTGVRSFQVMSEPVSNFKDRMIVTGLKAMVNTTCSIDIEVDGSTTAAATTCLAGENWVFAAPGTKGRHYAARWTNAGVDAVEWAVAPISEWSKRIIPHRVRVAHDDAVTSNLWFDGNLMTATGHVGNYESDIFFTPNQRGFLPQLTWGQKHLRILEWFYDPEEAFEDKVLIKGCTVTYEGDLTFYVHVDGTEKVSESLSNVGRTSVTLEILPGAVGFVYQWSYVQDSANSGWVHAVKWNIEKEPSKNVTVPDLLDLDIARAYIYRVDVIHQGAVSPATLSFSAFVDDVELLTTNLTTFDSVDWDATFLEFPTNTIGHTLGWDSEGEGFIRQVRWDIAPDMRRRQIYPIPGYDGVVNLRKMWIQYIGTVTLKVYADQTVVFTKTLTNVGSKTNVQEKFPLGTRARVVMYDYTETAKDSGFIFSIDFEAAKIL